MEKQIQLIDHLTQLVEAFQLLVTLTGVIAFFVISGLATALYFTWKTLHVIKAMIQEFQELTKSTDSSEDGQPDSPQRERFNTSLSQRVQRFYLLFPWLF